jgi:hypothetical protein
MGYSRAQGNSCQTPFKICVVHLPSVDLKDEKTCGVSLLFWTWLKDHLFSRSVLSTHCAFVPTMEIIRPLCHFESKTTKKSLHSQYLYSLRVPDAIGWFSWPWKGELGLGKEEWLGEGGGGCDATFGPDRKTRWFSNGWLLRIRCYSVLQSHFFPSVQGKMRRIFSTRR